MHLCSASSSRSHPQVGSIEMCSFQLPYGSQALVWELYGRLATFRLPSCNGLRSSAVIAVLELHVVSVLLRLSLLDLALRIGVLLCLTFLPATAADGSKGNLEFKSGRHKRGAQKPTYTEGSWSWALGPDCRLPLLIMSLGPP